MTGETMRRGALATMAAGNITATIVPFPSRQAQAQARAQREALRILRALPYRYRRPWVRMGERMVNGMPTPNASALFHIECDIADFDAGLRSPGVAS